MEEQENNEINETTEVSNVPVTTSNSNGISEIKENPLDMMKNIADSNFTETTIKELSNSNSVKNQMKIRNRDKNKPGVYLSDKDYYNYVYKNYIVMNKSASEVSKELNISDSFFRKRNGAVGIKKDPFLTGKRIREQGIFKYKKSEETIRRSRETRYRKYGGYFSSDTIKQIKRTKLERYGDENYINKEKSKRTCLEKYGVEEFLSSDYAKRKQIETNNRLFGVDYVGQRKDVRNKINNTFKERYNCTSPLGIKGVKEKIFNTNLKKYGSKYAFHSNMNKTVMKQRLNKISKQSIEIIDNKDKFHDFILSIDFKDRTIYNCSRILKISQSLFAKTVNKYNFKNLINHYRSKFEFDISDILNRNNYNFITNTKKIISPYELDFYFPDYNLAIEFNGNYWHNKDNPVRENLKTKLCKEKGIKLIHIWEDEWNNINDKEKFIINLLKGDIVNE